MAGTAEPLDVNRLLAAAQTAVADHRALGMVDELADLAGSDPDPRLAQRLVALRHAALGELDGKPGRPSWPLDLTDPFPGEEGVPEVTRGELSGDLLGGAIVNHGCFRVNGLVTEAVADRIRESIDHTFEARERLTSGESQDAAPWFVEFAPGQAKAKRFGPDGFIRLVDSPSTLCDLAAVFNEIGVADAVRDYFGERPAMIASKWVMRRQQNGQVINDFHQDGAFLGEGIRAVNCWISLSHCGPGTGRPGIDLVPRRFDVLESGAGAVFKWSLNEELVREVASGAPVVAPVFAPGDAMFFDERLPHRTTVGTDLITRYAVESWFVAPSSYPLKDDSVLL